MELYDFFSQASQYLLQERAIRAVLMVAGVSAMVHFGCMACVCHGPCVPHVDALLIACTGAAGFGVAFAALASSMEHLMGTTALLCACLVGFSLRLWWKGFHVSRFLKELHACK